MCKNPKILHLWLDDHNDLTGLNGFEGQLVADPPTDRRVGRTENQNVTPASIHEDRRIAAASGSHPNRYRRALRFKLVEVEAEGKVGQRDAVVQRPPRPQTGDENITPVLDRLVDAEAGGQLNQCIVPDDEGLEDLATPSGKDDRSLLGHLANHIWDIGL